MVLSWTKSSGKKWKRLSNLDVSQIVAEDRRLKYQEAYESLVDFVFEINNRTDLDKVRKGQMIHDRACELKL